MSLKISVLVTLLVAHYLLQSSVCLDEKTYVRKLLDTFNVQLRNSRPCIVGTRYRMQRCSGKRGFRKNKQVFQNRKILTSVSMRLTVSSQTAKNLTVNRQKRGNFIVNRLGLALD